MVRKALLIGINYVGTNAELRGCINDVVNMKKFIMKEFGFRNNEIVVLTESSQKKPTRENIITYMQWLVKNNNEQSRLFLHYSGHGSYVRDKNGDEVDGKDETIVPLDYQKGGMIIDDDLRKILVDPLKKGSKLTTIFDCCHSGTVLDLRCNVRVTTNPRDTSFNVREDRHYDPSKGKVVCFSGCRDDQYSADAFEGGQATGAMTYCFLQTMKKYRKKGKLPKMKDLIKELNVLIKQKGYKQIPQLSTGCMVNFNEKFSVM